MQCREHELVQLYVVYLGAPLPGAAAAAVGGAGSRAASQRRPAPWHLSLASNRPASGVFRVSELDSSRQDNGGNHTHKNFFVHNASALVIK